MDLPQLPRNQLEVRHGALLEHLRLQQQGPPAYEFFRESSDDVQPQ